MNKKWLVVILCAILIIFMIVLFIFEGKKDNDRVEENKENKDSVILNEGVIPEFNIKLNNIELDDIHNNSKDEKYEGNDLKIIVGDKEVLDKNIIIKGRGNTTWYYPKRSYQIKFDEKINLFNLGESKKWVLLAEFCDPSFLKTAFSLKLGEVVGTKYNIKGTYIKLSINDEYLGMYYLLHKVEINKSSVDINNPDGVLMELDNIQYPGEDEGDVFVSNLYNTHFVFKDIVDEDKKDQAIESFMNKYNELELAIENDDWDKICELFDVESMAKYYTVSNFIRNDDAYRTSFFWYMDGKDDKLHIGPLWDFDRTLLFSKDILNPSFGIDTDQLKLPGKVDLSNGEFERMIRIPQKLSKFEKFKELVSIEQNKIRENKDEIMAYFDEMYQYIKEDASVNCDMWMYMSEYDNIVKDLRKSIEKRFNTIDTSFNDR